MYKIFNLNISLNLINQEYFAESFSKYFFLSPEDPDITIHSMLVDSIFYDENKIMMKSKFHMLCRYDDYDEYLLMTGDQVVAKCRCDEKNGKYEFFILEQSSILENEYILIQCVFSRYLIHHKQAIFIHSSCILYQGHAIMFSAPSGTGKSTHSSLWKEYYQAEYINDDKNFILLEHNQLMVYGSPISGKHQLDNNLAGALKAIVFLKQGKENKAVQLSMMDGLLKLMAQIQRPSSRSSYDNSEETFQRVIKLPMYELICDISKEAVDTIKDKIFGV